MTDNITLPRSVIEQVLEALNASKPYDSDIAEDWSSHIAARSALRAALEQPKPPPSTVWRFVPTTMTDAMAAVDKELRHTVPWIRWEAILAAAPQPPRQPLTEEVRILIGSMVSELRAHRYCGDCYPENGWPEVNKVLADYVAFKRAHGIGGEA